MLVLHALSNIWNKIMSQNILYYIQRQVVIGEWWIEIFELLSSLTLFYVRWCIFSLTCGDVMVLESCCFSADECLPGGNLDTESTVRGQFVCFCILCFYFAFWIRFCWQIPLQWKSCFFSGEVRFGIWFKYCLKPSSGSPTVGQNLILNMDGSC